MSIISEVWIECCRCKRRWPEVVFLHEPVTLACQHCGDRAKGFIVHDSDERPDFESVPTEDAPSP